MARRKTRNLKSKPKKNQIQIDRLVEELVVNKKGDSSGESEQEKQEKTT